MMMIKAMIEMVVVILLLLLLLMMMMMMMTMMSQVSLDCLGPVDIHSEFFNQLRESCTHSHLKHKTC